MNTSYHYTAVDTASEHTGARSSSSVSGTVASLLAMLLALVSSRIFRGCACTLCAVGALLLIGALQAGMIAAVPCLLLCAVIGGIEFLLLR